MRQPFARTLLLPFSVLYGLIVRSRNWLFDIGLFEQKEFDVCTLVVGNLAVGGTGKTPHVISLARSLSQEFEVAILTRGYKRKSKGFRWVQTEDNVKLTGDEGLEMKTHLPNIHIATDGNRRRGITRILSDVNPKPEIIILDDGFQHRKVKPVFSIIMSKISDLYIQDHLLPSGNLREPRHGAKRAHAICISSNQLGISTDDLRAIIPLSEEQILLSSRVKYSFSSSLTPDKKTDILLITSIADPIPLLEHIESISTVIKHLKFRDHYDYTENDIQNIIHSFNKLKASNKLIVTTGKDLVKLKQFKAFEELPHSCAEIEIEFLENGKERLLKEITSYVRKN